MNMYYTHGLQVANTSKTHYTLSNKHWLKLCSLENLFANVVWTDYLIPVCQAPFKAPNTLHRLTSKCKSISLEIGLHIDQEL